LEKTIDENSECTMAAVQQGGWSQSDGSVGAEAAMATTAEVLCPVGNMVSVMTSTDLLRRILCSYEASQATIETLLWMKCVSKLWPGVVKFMLADAQWMAPLTRSGQTFVDGFHFKRWNIVEQGAEGVAFAQVDLSDFLEKMRLHTWHEASQHHGLVALFKHIPKDNLAYFANVYYERLLKISNDAMATHPNSLRVQKAGVSLQGALFPLQDPFTFSFEHFRAADVLTNALGKFCSLTHETDFVESMLSNMQDMLGQHRSFSQIFRDMGAIEIVIKCMKDFDHSYDVVCKCDQVIFGFPVKHIPFMLSCGIERVIFTSMQKHQDDCRLQSDSIASLALLYRHGPHSFDSLQDLTPFDLLFDATKKFMHDDVFFRAAVFIFSILMVDVNLFEIHNRFVLEGLVKVIVRGMSFILQCTPRVEREEVLYSKCTQILFNIAMFEPLRIHLACPAIKILLEAGMVVFTLNVKMFIQTCHLFRVVFFLPSEARRLSPSLRLVTMVLDAMSDNFNEHLLHVECMLTLNMLMTSRQVLNFVGQQDGFKKITCSLDYIIGADCISRARIKMGLKFPHTVQSEFVMASLSLLCKLPLRRNLTAPSLVSSSNRLARVVFHIMRQHDTQIGVQSLALCVLDKYMLPYPASCCIFRFGIGMALLHSAMNLPDLSSESHVIAQKLIRVCST